MLNIFCIYLYLGWEKHKKRHSEKYIDICQNNAQLLVFGLPQLKAQVRDYTQMCTVVKFFNFTLFYLEVKFRKNNLILTRP